MYSSRMKKGPGSLSLFLKGKKKVQIKLSLWPLGIYVDFSDPVNKCRIAWKFCEPSKGQQQGMALTAVQFKFNFWFIGKQKQTILLENNKRFCENQIKWQQLAGMRKQKLGFVMMFVFEISISYQSNSTSMYQASKKQL